MTFDSAAPGFVLIAVLVVTLMAAMIAAGLLYRVQAESAASAAITNGEQAYAAALSGLHTALTALTTSPPGAAAAPSQSTGRGSPTPPIYIADLEAWHDNPQLFRNRLVTDDGVNRWYFTVYAQNFNDEENVRYGLIDESGKINLNTASEDVLARLPGMTPQLLDALLDYRDRDSQTRPDGAEQDYYDQLPQPYLIENGAFATVEELLLVKGFTGGVVYGEDANLNGLLEPNEDDGDELFPPDDGDGRLEPGLFAYLTTTAGGPELDADGNPKIDLNRAAAQQLQEIGLSQETVDFIMAFRQDRGRFEHPSELLEMEYTPRGERQPRRATNVTLLDDSYSDVIIDYPRTQAQPISSGVGAAELPLIMARLTAGRNRGRPQAGLVNVNTAPPAVLAALPQIDAGLARQIADARDDLNPDTRASTAWLFTQGLVDAAQYKAAAPLLTARGYQYRLRCVGFGVPSGRYRVVEAVIDTVGPSRIAYLRDITRLGVPFPLDAAAEEQ